MITRLLSPAGIALMVRQSSFEYHQEIELRDGRKVILRPIRPSDRTALLSFHSRLSEDTRYLRYQYFKNELTETDLKNFCDTDCDNTLALVAEEWRESGYGSIIGLGQYFRLSTKQTAEVAFVVQDNEQKKGIGTQMLKYLAGLALQHDILYFTAEVMLSNYKMLSIFRKADPEMATIRGGSTCTVVFRVAEVISRTLHNGYFNSQGKS